MNAWMPSFDTMHLVWLVVGGYTAGAGLGWHDY